MTDNLELMDYSATCEKCGRTRVTVWSNGLCETCQEQMIERICEESLQEEGFEPDMERDRR